MQVKVATAIERMVDQACGLDDTTQNMIAEEFVIWATKRFWGLDEAPTAFQERVKQHEHEKENRTP